MIIIQVSCKQLQRRGSGQSCGVQCAGSHTEVRTVQMGPRFNSRQENNRLTF